MSVSFKGIGEVIVTFKAGEGVAPGAPVKVSGEGAVSPALEGDAFVGVAQSVRGGFCAVQIAGYAEVPYSGAAPSFGGVTLCADGNGGLKADAAGRAVTLLHLDTAASRCGVLL